jgi:pyruvate/2-oxoacid:ferredoxin oxidoreductase alpha subunit
MPPRKGKEVAPPPAPEEVETSDDIHGEEEKLQSANETSNNTVQDRMTKMKQLRQRMVSLPP